MYLLRLFHESDPAQPVAAHMLRDGTTLVGRDPTADWTIPDPDCQISRHHIELECHDGAIVMRPLGANGVFLEEGGARLPDGAAVPIALGACVHFGQYRMVVDSAPFATRSGASFERTMVFAAPEPHDIPADWSDADPLPPAADEGSLLEAFCEGAKLDVSALSGHEQAEIMRRAGAIYRQMVLGLTNLVGERTAAKAALHMDRTTIGAEGNNPLKWAPSRRLAMDLLLGDETAFLAGPGAIRDSFDEVKTHMAGVARGYEATLQAVLDQLDPAAVAGRVDGHTAFLKGRAGLCWEAYEKLHGDLRRRIAEHGDGALRDAFVAAYDAATTEPDRAAVPPGALDAAE
jgi:predicted component of type VI protein secretion system